MGIVRNAVNFEISGHTEELLHPGAGHGGLAQVEELQHGLQLAPVHAAEEDQRLLAAAGGEDGGEHGAGAGQHHLVRPDPGQSEVSIMAS